MSSAQTFYLHLFFVLASDYLENRSSDLENKTKDRKIKQKIATSSQREDDKKNNVHTRQEDATEESCRGGWLLSTVSLRNLGDGDQPPAGKCNSGTSNSTEIFTIDSLKVL
jgi:hypothetical protein